jgi:hypothetical protein
MELKALCDRRVCKVEDVLKKCFVVTSDKGLIDTIHPLISVRLSV